MSVRTVILLVHCLLGTSLAMECREVPGRLKQIDASVGQVFGVNENDNIYTLYGDTWTQLPGALKHVTVGPSGVWGTNRNNLIYKLVGANWVQVGGLLKQVDAGGDQFVAGANMNDNIYCLGRDPTVEFRNSASPAPWNLLPGLLMYYSCGPNGCWGVNSLQDIYLRTGVTPATCSGTGNWQQIAGKLVMVEVGTDGSVYGVNAGGDVYRRDGISASQPAGTGWTQLTMCGKGKHVSYDLGHLWVITSDYRILDCTI
ncbi:fish-egg lectin-like [Anguilla anguilla]|uniref:fish-egg lectin-like n=1 Tax=Anguilla anguilla TaxID=7936 RepID=UPI0015B25B0D|nr:fish-egg lectin-like [Anguilla anguilla]